ncbi:unnamed protein product [Cylicostephanus goldi]|uniref:Uncharacterized protein n=1 Tax=Cylicostephanus goldi TaxID=71465 RepID=A0A3P6TL86_CYLGO|nr:unnamed protein product [Cylicostephanus goldi]
MRKFRILTRSQLIQRHAQLLQNLNLVRTNSLILTNKKKKKKKKLKPSEGTTRTPRKMHLRLAT